MKMDNVKMKERSPERRMHFNFWKLSIALYLSFCAASVYAVSGPVGSVNGSFSVTPDGAASYVIPIKVPTGIGGIKPAISLTYNSQARNGLLGVGWNLSGLSTITRCPQNLAQDDQIRDVKLDADDRFCLDGQRLVAISGVYGEHNTEYRTEQDSFVKIISKGFVDNGPESFEVLTKDGRRLQFGDVAANASGQFNSRFAPHGKEAVHIWGISHISDNVGNAIEFTYQFVGDEESATGTNSAIGYNREYYPDQITYSGGEVYFSYAWHAPETRPDPIMGYRGGGKVQTLKSLRNIVVVVKPGELVRKYKLVYKLVDDSNQSRLSTVTECGPRADGEQCFPATQITWQSDQNSDKPAWLDADYPPLPFGVMLARGDGKERGVRFVDLDGDGVKDIVYHRLIGSGGSPPLGSLEDWMPHNGESGSLTVEIIQAWMDDYMDTEQLKMDAYNFLVQQFGYWLATNDDIDDIVPLEERDAWSEDYIASGGGENFLEWYAAYNEFLGNWLIDNGELDLVPIQKITTWVNDYVVAQVGVKEEEIGAYLYKNNTWQSAPGFHPPHPLIRDDGKATGSEIIDINGDGLVDFVYSRLENATTHNSAAYLNDGSGWVKDESGKFNPKYPLGRYDNQHRVAQFTDLNGDGLVDLVHKDRKAIRTCDFDSCTPFLHTVEQGAYLGTPTGWSENKLSHIPPIAFDPVIAYFRDGQREWEGDPNPRVSRLIDINGDGLNDLLFYYKSGASGVYLKTSTGWEISPAVNYKPPFNLYGDDHGESGARFMDVNGDGLVDIVQHRYLEVMPPAAGTGTFIVIAYELMAQTLARASHKRAYLNTGNGWVQNDDYIPPQPTFLRAGGSMKDVAYVYQDVDVAHVYQDVNADGLVDLLFQRWDDETQGVYLNTGSGWQRNDKYSPPHDLIRSNGKSAGTRIIDLNGDGKLDIVHSYETSAGMMASNTERHLVNSITTGLGVTTSISYKPLTDATVYTQGMVGCQSPIVCVKPPSLVVNEHQASNGIGGMARYTYQYADARVHRLGRGWLGFASRSTTDLQTQQVTTTTYDNRAYDPAFKVFPFLNLPQKISISYPGTLFGDKHVVISETINHYSMKRLAEQPYYSVYLQSSSTETIDLDGTPLKYILTTTEMDDYGNALSINVDTQQSLYDQAVAYRQTTTNTYDNDPVNWHLGRLRTASVTSYEGQNAQTRTTAYGYYPAGHASAGMLEWTEDEAGDPDLYLKTKYTYDAYGNADSVTVSGSSTASYPITERTTRNVFDYATNQLFPEVTTIVPVQGSITHSETKVFDARWGKLVSQTGPNDLTSSWTYDAFGRRHTETLPDDNKTTWSYAWCDGSCPAHAVYKVITTRSDGAGSTGYMDVFSRQLRSQTLGLDGVVIQQDMEYDAVGRLWRSSRPYFAGATHKDWSSKTFDTLSRVKTRINPDGSVVSNDYQGLQITVSTERRTGGEYTSLSVRQIKNLAGQVEWVYDAHNNGTRYTYLPFGEPETVTDPLGNVIIMEYDHRGRKTKMLDPDMGTWHYASDALGNTRWQRDAKGQETSMDYDLLNRLRTRVDAQNPADANSKEKISEWQYFTAADAASSCRSIGKLKSSSDGSISKNYCYDDLGRSILATSSFAGASYSVATDYDEFSRVKTITYPAQGAGEAAFVKRNVYDAYGHLKSVHDGAGNDALWVAEQVDPSGNITTEVLGNGLTTSRVYDAAMGYLKSINTGAGSGRGVQSLAFEFDNLGTLISRTDHNRVITQSNGSMQNGSTESFTYDVLNRVSTVLRDGRQTTQYQYDALGNITFNSELGTYLYNSTRPHAVTDIKRSNTGTLAGDISNDGRINALDAALLGRNLVGLSALNSPQMLAADCNAANGVNLDDSVCIAAHAGSTSSTIDEKLSYDANGNMLRGIAGKMVTYTAFNKPEIISKGAYSTRFAYDTARSRYLQVASDANGGTTTTHYVGQLFERIEKPNGVIEYKNYIHAGSRMIAISTRRSDNSSDLNYLHRDHINSISAITDAEGLVKARFSYGVFGKRRDDATWKAASPQEFMITSVTASDITHHGYTEHELLAGVGLIHMNGRVFDPELARFLSPDPLIQFEHNLQSFNRYSYVLNNPLSFADPSGYSLCRICDDVGDAISGAASDIKQGIRDFRDDINGFMRENGRTIVAIGITVALPGNPVAAGFLSSLIASGGDLKAAVVGGITAGIFVGLHDFPANFGKVVAHGMVGGTSSVINGGSFKAGFMSAAVTQSVSQVVGNDVFGDPLKSRVRLKNAFAAGVIGGTTSVLTGGRFANGAMTGAFSRMFNDLNATMLQAEAEALREAQDELLLAKGEYLLNKEYTFFASDGRQAYDASEWRGFMANEIELSYGKFSVLQAIIPGASIGVARYPLGGSMSEQARYSRTTSYVRQTAAQIACYRCSSLGPGLALGVLNFSINHYSQASMKDHILSGSN